MSVPAQAPSTATAARPVTAAEILTGLIILLGAVASWGGLFLPDLYRDSPYMVAQAVGQDMVTLYIALPALAVALWFVRRGSGRATLAWIGLLAYMLYTYTTYAFGAAFNRFFLIYVALFSLSIAAMVAALGSINAAAWQRRFDAGTPRRPVAVFFFFIALMLCGLWLPPIIGFLTSGELPATMVLADIPTNFVYVMDLGIVVPLTALTGVWLWRRQPWGDILAGVVLVKAVTMGLALLAMIWCVVRGGGALEVAPAVMFSMVTAGSLGLSVWFFRHCR